MLIFEKIINNKKHTSKFMNKNHATIPSFISATAIQFRRRIKPISKRYITEKNNKQIQCEVPIDKYKFNILSYKAFKEALLVVGLYILFTFITAICIY